MSDRGAWQSTTIECLLAPPSGSIRISRSQIHICDAIGSPAGGKAPVGGCHPTAPTIVRGACSPTSHRVRRKRSMRSHTR